MNFISEIEQTVVAKCGRVIKFLEGVITHVPPDSHADVIAAGCVPAEAPAEATPSASSESQTAAVISTVSDAAAGNVAA